MSDNVLKPMFIGQGVDLHFLLIMLGLIGGMIAFELHGGLEQGMRFMNALRLATRAVSLGDAETRPLQFLRLDPQRRKSSVRPDQQQRHMKPQQVDLRELPGGAEPMIPDEDEKRCGVVG